MAFVCGTYNRKTGKIGQLQILVLEEEEIREGYEAGEIIEVTGKPYALLNRKPLPGSLVQYDMILQKETQ